MRGWFRPIEDMPSEEMHATDGLRLYIKLTQKGTGYRTDPGGFVRRQGGWLYGASGGRSWAIPESAVVGIEEA